MKRVAMFKMFRTATKAVAAANKEGEEEELAPEDLPLLDAFQKFDVNGDGFIDKEELKALLVKYLDLKQPPTEQQISKIISAVDLDNDGKISFKDFKNMMRKDGDVETTKYFKTFNTFDRDEDGYITYEDLKEVLQLVHEDLKDEEIMSIMKQLDQDGDGKSIQQFQLLQQPRSPGFGGYGTTFITPHHSLMYATRDVAFYPSALTASDYNLPYTVQQPEKQVSVSAAEPAVSKAEPAPPPPKAPRTSKKNGDKSGSTYASRHQAAESRRRQRINDRLDTLRKVVPHRDRANTAAFLEEVISYVVGLKKRVADLEGVSEDKISVPQVDVGGMLNVAPPNGGAATVLGNPTLPTGTANPAETMQLAMLDGMGGQPMPVSGPIMAGMPFQDAGAGPDLSKGLPARGMPTPALNANQVLVPVALMPDQPNGGQAYMLVNRDEFPMMAGQPFLGMQPAPEVAQPKQTDEDGLMDVLVGAAVQVEEGDNEADTEGTDNGDEEGGGKSMTTRSGRKRNPTQRMF